jgi:predicted small secreted protein
MHKHYNGNDQIQTANGVGMDIIHNGKSVLPTSTNPLYLGTGMDIIHNGKSVLPTSTCPLHLNHVLHVPHGHKQLVSIHRFNLDNNTFSKHFSS